MTSLPQLVNEKESVPETPKAVDPQLKKLTLNDEKTVQCLTLPEPDNIQAENLLRSPTIKVMST